MVIVKINNIAFLKLYVFISYFCVFFDDDSKSEVYFLQTDFFFCGT